ncbi:MAG: hypothetical protein ING85_00055, partial [Phenylobacterium sp.]|uniref:beta strand repeat-containing protein n=2 Tax=Phenylobacterium sp. TaxID=1871053 RepID=UPI0025E4F613
IGASGADLLRGNGGADTLEGGSGADTIDGGAGVDLISYAGASAGVAASLTSTAGVGSGTGGEAAGDVITGAEGLVGSAFNDTLGAVGGSQTLQGGAGNDVYVLDGTGAVTVTEAAGAGVDEMRTSTRSTLTLATNVENLTNLGSGNFTGTGNTLANVMTGGSGKDSLQGLDGADTLNGGAGADTLDGGVGVDLVSYAGAASGVSLALNASGGIATAGGAAAGDVFVSIEGVIGSSFNDTLDGSDVNNLLIGASGADLLRGNGGADTLEGGSGADTIDGGAGVDLINYAGASAGVAASLTSTAGAGSGTGGEAAGDVITGAEGLVGSAFNDTLGAVGGSQTLQGGAGNDVYELGGTATGAVTVTEAAGAGVDEMRTSTRSTLTLATNVENLTNLGSGNFTGTGNTLANVMTGGSGNDSLQGLDGADTLNGGAGADTLDGGVGVDLVSYAGAASGVSLALNASGGLAAAAGGAAAGDVLSGIEGLSGSSFNDTLDGSDASNLLIGASGADLLRGNGGADTLEGGSGADTIDGGAGVDLISYAGASAGVAASLTSTAGAGSGTGGEAAGDVITGAEVLVGSAFNDTLGAVGGSQTLQGEAGNDVYELGGTGAVTVIEVAGAGVDEMRTSTRSTLTLAENVENLTNLGSGNFTGTGNELANVMTGGSGNDFLDGLDGADTLNGGAGADTLFGSVGVDRLTGGTGADLFVFGALDALSATGGVIDQITDFATGSDRLKIGVTGPVEALSPEASYASALASAISSLGTGSWNIVTVAVGTTTYVFADTNNDNKVDTAIALIGTSAPTVVASDFAP